MRLVDEYLPEKRSELLDAGGVGEMLSAFAHAFEQLYFPLADFFDYGEVENFSDLTRAIPIDVQGIEWDAYHDLVDFRHGFILSSLLVDFETELGMDGEGIRVTLVEAASRLVSPQLLMKLPEKGYSLDHLKEILTGGPHSGLLYHAQYLCHDTGCDFLDACNEEVWNSGGPEWNRENVDGLKEEWETAKRLNEAMKKFYEWLEENPEAHFAQIIAILERREYEKPDPRQLRLPLDFAEGTENLPGSPEVPGGYPQ